MQQYNVLQTFVLGQFALGHGHKYDHESARGN